MRYLPYKLVEGKGGRCEIKEFNSDKVLAPEELSAKVLGEMKRIAEVRCGREVIDAVITVPAYFNALQKQATHDAAKIAGLKPLRVINEPTAAAMACSFHANDENKTILVFDFGGGTFDISILFCSEGVLDVGSTRGDMRLGGLDLDNVLMKICETKIWSELTL